MANELKSFKELALDDIINLLNVALNRVHSTDFSCEESWELIDALCAAKNKVATATSYLPKNF
jgi:hypothetical protein